MPFDPNSSDDAACNAGIVQVRTSLVSRNITVAKRRTSIRLEPEMWSALKDIAGREGCSVHDICTLVSIRKKDSSSLTAAIRVFIMLYFRAAATDDGHKRAGHGDFDHMRMRARIPAEMLSLFSSKVAQSKSLPSESLTSEAMVGA